MDLERVWQKVLDTVRGRSDFDLGFWRALEAAKPVACENGYFVVGFPHEQVQHKGRLLEDSYRSLITHIIRSASPDLAEVDLRVIDGATPADWEREKEFEDAKRQHLSRQGLRQAELESIGLSWETLSEKLSVQFTQARASRYPQTAARFLLEAFATVAELESQGGEAAALERRLARVFNRLGGMTGIPPTQVALEYLRFKGQAKAQS